MCQTQALCNNTGAVFVTKYDLQKAINEFFSDNSAAISLYGNMNCWDVSAITDMSSLFYWRTSMNENIGCWDVSHVTQMSSMFSFASAFNQDLSLWNTSQVQDFSYMFYGATSFNQSLCNWFQHISNNTPNIYSMFIYSGCTLKFDLNLNTKLHFCSKCQIPVMKSGKFLACFFSALHFSTDDI